MTTGGTRAPRASLVMLEVYVSCLACASEGVCGNWVLAVFGGVKSRFFFFFFFKVLGCLSPSTWLKGLRFVGALFEGSVQPPLFLGYQFPQCGNCYQF